MPKTIEIHEKARFQDNDPSSDFYGFGKKKATTSIEDYFSDFLPKKKVHTIYKFPKNENDLQEDNENEIDQDQDESIRTLSSLQNILSSLN